ncbi:MAG TPA: DUF4403 family protein [Desulfuromonadales bacterium]|nr:DUF4403 family protein [Desulfuromonadales bacterium]
MRSNYYLAGLTLFLVTALLFAASSNSCADTSVTAEKPALEAFRAVLNKETSTLNIPIEMSADELAKILNLTVRKELYKGATKTKGLSADVLRNGPIVMSASDNFLYITLPVTLSVSYSMFETRPLPLKLKFKVTASVLPDWRLRTEVYYQGVSDLLAEEVGVGPLSFKPRTIVDGIMHPVQKIVSDLVAQKINELLPLKAQVTKVWNTAQAPILLDKKYNSWLKLTPREVMLFPLYAQNNRVKLSIGINTFAEMVIGPEPITQPLQPLPNLKLVNSFDKTFRIALNADLFYKDLRAIAAPLLLDKKFDSDGKSVVIKDFDLYGNGDKLVVKLVTQGSLDGLIYLTAKPVFNPQTNVFSVEDVDFDLQTQSLLLTSAAWFLHGTIRGMIQEKLNMNVTQQLEQSRQIAAKALTRMKLLDHVYLKCDIKNLKFKDVIVQQDKISIQVYTEGESAILFQ